MQRTYPFKISGFYTKMLRVGTFSLLALGAGVGLLNAPNIALAQAKDAVLRPKAPQSFRVLEVSGEPIVALNAGAFFSAIVADAEFGLQSLGVLANSHVALVSRNGNRITLRNGAKKNKGISRAFFILVRCMPRASSMRLALSKQRPQPWRLQ